MKNLLLAGFFALASFGGAQAQSCVDVPISGYILDPMTCAYHLAPGASPPARIIQNPNASISTPDVSPSTVNHLPNFPSPPDASPTAVMNQVAPAATVAPVVVPADTVPVAIQGNWSIGRPEGHLANCNNPYVIYRNGAGWPNNAYKNLPELTFQGIYKTEMVDSSTYRVFFPPTVSYGGDKIEPEHYDNIRLVDHDAIVILREGKEDLNIPSLRDMPAYRCPN
jgi:hypothetical protein